MVDNCIISAWSRGVGICLWRRLFFFCWLGWFSRGLSWKVFCFCEFIININAFFAIFDTQNLNPSRGCPTPKLFCSFWESVRIVSGPVQGHFEQAFAHNHFGKPRSPPFSFGLFYSSPFVAWIIGGRIRELQCNSKAISELFPKS